MIFVAFAGLPGTAALLAHPKTAINCLCNLRKVKIIKVHNGLHEHFVVHSVLCHDLCWLNLLANGLAKTVYHNH